jgi:hypothetical protein
MHAEPLIRDVCEGMIPPPGEIDEALRQRLQPSLRP